MAPKLTSNSLFSMLLFPLGMALGFLLAGVLDKHACPPCQEVHVAHHDFHLRHHARKHLNRTHHQQDALNVSLWKAKLEKLQMEKALERLNRTGLLTPPAPTAPATASPTPAPTPSATPAPTERPTDSPTKRRPGKDNWREGYQINKPGLEVLARAPAPAPLILTFGSIAMSDFILNWVTHIELLNATSKDFLVGCLDQPLLDLCEAKGIPGLAVAGTEGLMTHTDYFRANEKKFVQMGEIKTDLLRGLVAAGYHVLISDADVVFMADPWPWLLPGRATSANQAVRVAAMVHTDVLTTTDCVDEEEDTAERHWLMNKEYNTGVMFLRGTPGSVALVDRWKERIFAEKGQGLYINDQAVFNRAFHGDVRRPLQVDVDLSMFPGEDPAAPPSKHQRWYDAANQRATYFVTPWEAPAQDADGKAVTIGVLPMVEFLNGHSFFVANLHTYYETEAVAVHATYQFGDSPEYSFGKRERLRQAGLWQVDDSMFYDGGRKFLHITGDMLEGWQAPPEEGEYDGGITYHIEADAWQRRRLQDAFALAHVLGRVLIMPRLHCFCDRYWWLLHECKTPGAERMDMPFQCPMDHIFEPSRFYQSNIDFRPYGFLDHRNVPDAIKTDRAKLPENLCPCFNHTQQGSGGERDPQRCESQFWQKIHAKSALMYPSTPDQVEWESSMRSARVLEVSVQALDTVCVEPEAEFQWKLKNCLSMHVGLCAKERNVIPPNWKPETHPLNCSWGYNLPKPMKDITNARRADLFRKAHGIVSG